VNRQIGVQHTKKVIVFNPLHTGHVIWRMRSGRLRIFNGNQRETLWLISQELIGVGSSNLVARLVTWPAMHSNCSRSKGQKSGSQSCDVSADKNAITRMAAYALVCSVLTAPNYEPYIPVCELMSVSVCAWRAKWEVMRKVWEQLKCSETIFELTEIRVL